MSFKRFHTTTALWYSFFLDFNLESMDVNVIDDQGVLELWLKNCGEDVSICARKVLLEIQPILALDPFPFEEFRSTVNRHFYHDNNVELHWILYILYSLRAGAQDMAAERIKAGLPVTPLPPETKGELPKILDL